MVLERPYSKLKFGPFLKLMVEEVVPQKAQQLSEFLSESDGWPLKLKLLSFFIKLEANDTNILLMSAFFSGIFLPQIQKHYLMKSSWRHSDVTTSDFCQSFNYDLFHR